MNLIRIPDGHGVRNVPRTGGVRNTAEPMRLQGRHGIYDLTGMHVSRHARDRYLERVAGQELQADEAPWAGMLKHCRKLGTSVAGDEAYLAMEQGEAFVLLVKSGRIVTIMTVPQFETVMADFGRTHWPRRFGRWIRRLERRSEDRDAGKA